MDVSHTENFDALNRVIFLCNNYFQTLAQHHLDIPHETPHLYRLKEEFDARGVQKGETVFVKTDFLDMFLQKIRPCILNSFHLITGHSDCSPSDWAVHMISNDPDIISWRAQNIVLETHKIRALPMGLSEPSRPFGDQEVVSKAMASDKPKTLKIAVPSFGVTHPVRAEIRDTLSSLRDRFSHILHIDDARRSFAEYLEILKGCTHVLAPRGNAIDCHRVYEAILMKCVPIYIGVPPPAFHARLPVQFLERRRGESVAARLERFFTDFEAGDIPSLPSDAEWDRFVDLIRAKKL